MKLQTILFPFYALPLVAHGKSLREVLKEEGFNCFGAQLENDPVTYQRFTDRSDVEIWAPVDQAYNETDCPKVNPRTLVARASGKESAANSQAGTHMAPDPSRKRADEPISNIETKITFVNDPAFVNLGVGQPGRIVQDAASAPGTSNAGISRIKSGGGTMSNQVSGPFKYDFGMIYGVDKRFSLPDAADKTLTDVGLSSFLAAVEAATLKDFINTQPSVTLLVPSNPDGINVREHIIQGPLGFISEFQAQQTLQTLAGTTVKIAQKNGVWYINGVQIIKSDIITKNGVIHTLEKPLSGTTSTSEISSSYGSKSPSGTTVARSTNVTASTNGTSGLSEASTGSAAGIAHMNGHLVSICALLVAIGMMF